GAWTNSHPTSVPEAQGWAFGLLGELALAIHGGAGDVSYVTQHGPSSTSVTYTQASTCALWRLTTMGLAFDFDSSRALASAVSSPLNSPVSTTVSSGWA